MGFNNLIQQLEYIRYGMIAEGGGSVIYPLCTFKSLMDIIRFSPKAVAIALFSPFPTDWVLTGTLGRVGRVFGAVETIAIYLLLPYVLIGLWEMAQVRKA